MTYYELFLDAVHKLNFNQITLGEYEEMIEPLKREIQQPCEDCISREAVMKCFKKWQPYMATRLWDYEQELKDLPSVTPERPKGKWIELEVCNCHATLKCSICNRVIEPTYIFGEYSYEDMKTFYPYCHCGAKMEVESENNNG